GPGLDLAGLRIHADDGVGAAFGHPRRAVGPNDDAVRRGGAAQGDELDLAGARIEAAELAVTLGRVPDDAVLADGDVVRSRGQSVGLDGDLRAGTRGEAENEREDEEDEMHAERAHIVLLGSDQTVTGL